MSLVEALTRRGYGFRQHLEEQGWGMRALTVVDLSEEQRMAFEQAGIAGLKTKLDEDGVWSFPAMDIEAPLPRRSETLLARDGDPCAAVVAPAGAAEERMARELIDRIEQRFGVRLPLLPDEGGADLLKKQSLIVVGGSHRSRVAMQLALRYQTFFLDATVPGDNGWAVTTHVGLGAEERAVAQISASPASWTGALECAVGALALDEGRLVWRSVHRVEQGSAMKAHFPSWEEFAAALPTQRLPQLEGKDYETPTDPEALADLLAVGLDSGGFEVSRYNAAPIDLAIVAARRYQLSGEPQALALFRALLFRLADYYLKTPEGASYPSDLDFRLGHLVLYFSRLEHNPAFSDEDRLILANLLLSCARSIHEYAEKMWHVDPDAATRHNHETFPALSQRYTADYFDRFGVSDVAAWRAYSDVVFGGRAWNRSKQKENASGYEAFTFEHYCAAQMFAGQEVPASVLKNMRAMVDRQISATDNFLRMSDYGDSAASLAPVDLVLPRLVSALDGDDTTRWYAAAGFLKKPSYLQSHIRDFPGIRVEAADTPPAAGEWERRPLDSTFLEERVPGFPANLAFDKLAFRTGWGDDDQYLLMEGVGSQNVSHAHNDTIGIVRMNHLGRHWLVSNGYGKIIGITNSSKAFSSRVRGPEDHNTLVAERGGEIVREIPATGALTQCGRSGSLLCATGALLGYGGVDWFRTLLVNAGKYVLVIDRVKVTGPGLEKARVEWNCLGEATALPNGFRLEQKGVFMDVLSESNWAAELGVADRSVSWQKVLSGDGYPHADFPVKKLTYRAPDILDGSVNFLATLLVASTGECPYEIVEPEAGQVVIKGPHEGAESFEDRDLVVRVDDTECDIVIATDPEIPEDLAAWRKDNG